MPGSPFVTMIFDTEEELARFTITVIIIVIVIMVVVFMVIFIIIIEQVVIKDIFRFLQGGYSPAGQANQSEFYGSIGSQTFSPYCHLC